MAMSYFFFNITANPGMFPLYPHSALPIYHSHRPSRGLYYGRHESVNGSVDDQLRALLSVPVRSEEHTFELQSPCNLVCRLLLETNTVDDCTPCPKFISPGPSDCNTNCLTH